MKNIFSVRNWFGIFALAVFTVLIGVSVWQFDRVQQFFSQAQESSFPFIGTDFTPKEKISSWVAFENGTSLGLPNQIADSNGQVSFNVVPDETKWYPGSVQIVAHGMQSKKDVVRVVQYRPPPKIGVNSVNNDLDPKACVAAGGEPGPVEIHKPRGKNANGEDKFDTKMCTAQCCYESCQYLGNCGAEPIPYVPQTTTEDGSVQNGRPNGAELDLNTAAGVGDKAWGDCITAGRPEATCRYEAEDAYNNKQHELEKAAKGDPEAQAILAGQYLYDKLEDLTKLTIACALGNAGALSGKCDEVPKLDPKVATKLQDNDTLIKTINQICNIKDYGKDQCNPSVNTNSTEETAKAIAIAANEVVNKPVETPGSKTTLAGVKLDKNFNAIDNCSQAGTSLVGLQTFTDQTGVIIGYANCAGASSKPLTQAEFDSKLTQAQVQVVKTACNGSTGLIPDLSEKKCYSCQTGKAVASCEPLARTTCQQEGADPAFLEGCVKDIINQVNTGTYSKGPLVGQKVDPKANPFAAITVSSQSFACANRNAIKVTTNYSNRTQKTSLLTCSGGTMCSLGDCVTDSEAERRENVYSNAEEYCEKSTGGSAKDACLSKYTNTIKQGFSVETNGSVTLTSAVIAKTCAGSTGNFPYEGNLYLCDGNRKATPSEKAAIEKAQAEQNKILAYCGRNRTNEGWATCYAQAKTLLDQGGKLNVNTGEVTVPVTVEIDRNTDAVKQVTTGLYVLDPQVVKTQQQCGNNYQGYALIGEQYYNCSTGDRALTEKAESIKTSIENAKAVCQRNRNSEAVSICFSSRAALVLANDGKVNSEGKMFDAEGRELILDNGQWITKDAYLRPQMVENVCGYLGQADQPDAQAQCVTIVQNNYGSLFKRAQDKCGTTGGTCETEYIKTVVAALQGEGTSPEVAPPVKVGDITFVPARLRELAGLPTVEERDDYKFPVTAADAYGVARTLLADIPGQDPSKRELERQELAEIILEQGFTKDQLANLYGDLANGKSVGGKTLTLALTPDKLNVTAYSGTTALETQRLGEKNGVKTFAADFMPSPEKNTAGDLPDYVKVLHNRTNPNVPLPLSVNTNNAGYIGVLDNPVGAVETQFGIGLPGPLKAVASFIPDRVGEVRENVHQSGQAAVAITKDIPVVGRLFQGLASLNDLAVDLVPRMNPLGSVTNLGSDFSFGDFISLGRSGVDLSGKRPFGVEYITEETPILSPLTLGFKPGGFDLSPAGAFNFVANIPSLTVQQFASAAVKVGDFVGSEAKITAYVDERIPTSCRGQVNSSPKNPGTITPECAGIRNDLRQEALRALATDPAVQFQTSLAYQNALKNTPVEVNGQQTNLFALVGTPEFSQYYNPVEVEQQVNEAFSPLRGLTDGAFFVFSFASFGQGSAIEQGLGKSLSATGEVVSAQAAESGLLTRALNWGLNKVGVKEVENQLGINAIRAFEAGNSSGLAKTVANGANLVAKGTNVPVLGYALTAPERFVTAVVSPANLAFAVPSVLTQIQVGSQTCAQFNCADANNNSVEAIQARELTNPTTIATNAIKEYLQFAAVQTFYGPADAYVRSFIKNPIAALNEVRKSKATLPDLTNKNEGVYAKKSPEELIVELKKAGHTEEEALAIALGAAQISGENVLLNFKDGTRMETKNGNVWERRGDNMVLVEKTPESKSKLNVGQTVAIYGNGRGVALGEASQAIAVGIIDGQTVATSQPGAGRVVRTPEQLRQGDIVETPEGRYVFDNNQLIHDETGIVVRDRDVQGILDSARPSGEQKSKVDGLIEVATKEPISDQVLAVLGRQNLIDLERGLVVVQARLGSGPIGDQVDNNISLVRAEIIARQKSDQGSLTEPEPNLGLLQIPATIGERVVSFVGNIVSPQNQQQVSVVQPEVPNTVGNVPESQVGTQKSGNSRFVVLNQSGGAIANDPDEVYQQVAETVHSTPQLQTIHENNVGTIDSAYTEAKNKYPNDPAQVTLMVDQAVFEVLNGLAANTALTPATRAVLYVEAEKYAGEKYGATQSDLYAFNYPGSEQNINFGVGTNTGGKVAYYYFKKDPGLGNQVGEVAPDLAGPSVFVQINPPKFSFKPVRTLATRALLVVALIRTVASIAPEPMQNVMHAVANAAESNPIVRTITPTTRAIDNFEITITPNAITAVTEPIESSEPLVGANTDALTKVNNLAGRSNAQVGSDQTPVLSPQNNDVKPALVKVNDVPLALVVSNTKPLGLSPIANNLIQSGYGYRSLTGATTTGGAPLYHDGTDFRTAGSDGKIRAVVPGKIVDVGNDRFFGVYILEQGIGSNSNVWILYGHTKGISGQVDGRIVEANTVIGTPGKPGEIGENSTGEHLHLAVVVSSTKPAISAFYDTTLAATNKTVDPCFILAIDCSPFARYYPESKTANVYSPGQKQILNAVSKWETQASLTTGSFDLAYFVDFWNHVFNVDYLPSDALAKIAVESNFQSNPNGSSDTNGRGLMQLTRDAWRSDWSGVLRELNKLPAKEANLILQDMTSDPSMTIQKAATLNPDDFINQPKFNYALGTYDQASRLSELRKNRAALFDGLSPAMQKQMEIAYWNGGIIPIRALEKYLKENPTANKAQIMFSDIEPFIDEAIGTKYQIANKNLVIDQKKVDGVVQFVHRVDAQKALLTYLPEYAVELPNQDLSDAFDSYPGTPNFISENQENLGISISETQAVELAQALDAKRPQAGIFGNFGAVGGILSGVVNAAKNLATGVQIFAIENQIAIHKFAYSVSPAIPVLAEQAVNALFGPAVKQVAGLAVAGINSRLPISAEQIEVVNKKPDFPFATAIEGFGPTFSQVVVEDTIGIKDGPAQLSQSFASQGRSSDLNESYGIIWGSGGEHYMAVNLKGNRWENIKIDPEPLDPVYGMRINGLADAGYINHAVRASNQMINDGVETERVEVLIRPGEFIYDGATLSWDQVKRLLVNKFNKDPRFVNYPAAQAEKFLDHFKPVIVVRSLQVSERLLDFVAVDVDFEKFKTMMGHIFNYVNLVDGEKLNPNSSSDITRYFRAVLPKRLANNLVKMHNGGLAHGFLHPQNVSGVGSLYDLDSVYGNPVTKQQITLEDVKSDLNRLLGEFDENVIRYLDELLPENKKPWLEAVFKNGGSIEFYRNFYKEYFGQLDLSKFVPESEVADRSAFLKEYFKDLPYMQQLGDEVFGLVIEAGQGQGDQVVITGTQTAPQNNIGRLMGSNWWVDGISEPENLVNSVREGNEDRSSTLLLELAEQVGLEQIRSGPSVFHGTVEGVTNLGQVGGRAEGDPYTYITFSPKLAVDRYALRPLVARQLGLDLTPQLMEITFPEQVKRKIEVDYAMAEEMLVGTVPKQYKVKGSLVREDDGQWYFVDDSGKYPVQVKIYGVTRTQDVVDADAQAKALSTTEVWDINGSQVVGGALGKVNEAIQINRDGKRWYVKFGNFDNVANEVLADEFYRTLGMPVVDSKMVVVNRDGKKRFARASVMVDNSDPRTETNYEDGFVADAFLANWDMYDPSARIGGLRVDNGGALLYRALGLKKGDKSPLEDEVIELESMRDGRFSGVKAYQNLSDQQILNQVSDVLEKLSPEKISELIQNSQLSDQSKADLTTKLLKRRESLENYYNQRLGESSLVGQPPNSQSALGQVRETMRVVVNTIKNLVTSVQIFAIENQITLNDSLQQFAPAFPAAVNSIVSVTAPALLPIMGAVSITPPPKVTLNEQGASKFESILTQLKDELNGVIINNQNYADLVDVKIQDGGIVGLNTWIKGRAKFFRNVDEESTAAFLDLKTKELDQIIDDPQYHGDIDPVDLLQTQIVENQQNTIQPWQVKDSGPIDPVVAQQYLVTLPHSSLSEPYANLESWTQIEDVGQRNIPLESIVDAQQIENWGILKRSNQGTKDPVDDNFKRMVNLAMLIRDGKLDLKTLDKSEPVRAIELNGIYFAKDGTNRISALKLLGSKSISANVQRPTGEKYKTPWVGASNSQELQRVYDNAVSAIEAGPKKFELKTDLVTTLQGQVNHNLARLKIPNPNLEETVDDASVFGKIDSRFNFSLPTDSNLLILTRDILRQRFGLPPIEKRLELPSAYANQIIAMAEQEGFRVVGMPNSFFVESGNNAFFEENTKTIAYNLDAAPENQALFLEHEYVHGIINERYPQLVGTPFYEVFAYLVGAGTHFLQSDMGGDMLVGLINGSLATNPISGFSSAIIKTPSIIRSLLYSQDESGRFDPKTPIKPGEIFDGPVELGKIRKMPSSQRAVAIDEFQDKLAYQLRGLTLVQEETVNELIKNPDMNLDQIMTIFNQKRLKYGFSNAQENEAMQRAKAYEMKHEFVKRLRSEYPDDKALFKATYGKEPVGFVKAHDGPISIGFEIYHADDYKFVKSLSDKDNLDAAGGFTTVRSLIPGADNLFFVIYRQLYPTDEDVNAVFTHEQRHYIETLLGLMPDLKPKYEAYKELFDQALLPNSTAEDKRAFANEYISLYRKNVNNKAVREIFSYLDQFKHVDSTPEQQEILTRNLIEFFTTKGGTYDRWAGVRSDIRRILELVFGTTDSADVDKYANSIPLSVADDDSFKKSVKNALPAYFRLRNAGWSYERAFALLLNKPLSAWPREVERVLATKTVLPVEPENKQKEVIGDLVIVDTRAPEPLPLTTFERNYLLGGDGATNGFLFGERKQAIQNTMRLLLNVQDREIADRASEIIGVIEAKKVGTNEDVVEFVTPGKPGLLKTTNNTLPYENLPPPTAEVELALGRKQGKKDREDDGEDELGLSVADEPVLDPEKVDTINGMDESNRAKSGAPELRRDGAGRIEAASEKEFTREVWDGILVEAGPDASLDQIRTIADKGFEEWKEGTDKGLFNTAKKSVRMRILNAERQRAYEQVQIDEVELIPFYRAIGDKAFEEFPDTETVGRDSEVRRFAAETYIDLQRAAFSATKEAGLPISESTRIFKEMKQVIFEDLTIQIGEMSPELIMERITNYGTDGALDILVNDILIEGFNDHEFAPREEVLMKVAKDLAKIEGTPTEDVAELKVDDIHEPVREIKPPSRLGKALGKVAKSKPARVVVALFTLTGILGGGSPVLQNLISNAPAGINQVLENFTPKGFVAPDVPALKNLDDGLVGEHSFVAQLASESKVGQQTVKPIQAEGFESDGSITGVAQGKVGKLKDSGVQVPVVQVSPVIAQAEKPAAQEKSEQIDQQAERKIDQKSPVVPGVSLEVRPQQSQQLVETDVYLASGDRQTGNIAKYQEQLSDWAGYYEIPVDMVQALAAREGGAVEHVDGLLQVVPQTRSAIIKNIVKDEALMKRLSEKIGVNLRAADDLEKLYPINADVQIAVGEKYLQQNAERYGTLLSPLAHYAPAYASDLLKQFGGDKTKANQFIADVYRYYHGHKTDNFEISNLDMNVEIRHDSVRGWPYIYAQAEVTAEGVKHVVKGIHVLMSLEYDPNKLEFTPEDEANYKKSVDYFRNHDHTREDGQVFERLDQEKTFGIGSTQTLPIVVNQPVAGAQNVQPTNQNKTAIELEKPVSLENFSDRVASNYYIWPVQEFGLESVSTEMNTLLSTGLHHYGIDISYHGKIGAEVTSISKGKVVEFGYRYNYFGKYVITEDDFGNVVLYAHLSDFSPELKERFDQKFTNPTKTDQWGEVVPDVPDAYLMAISVLDPDSGMPDGGIDVERGQLIAKGGSTGNSTGPHLHFEIQNLVQLGFNSIDDMTESMVTNDPYGRKASEIGLQRMFWNDESQSNNEELAKRTNPSAYFAGGIPTTRQLALNKSNQQESIQQVDKPVVENVSVKIEPSGTVEPEIKVVDSETAPIVDLIPNLGDKVGVSGKRFVDESGRETFVVGINYEGPSDRQWQMWNDDKFDAGLIDADFGLAKKTGANSLRIFVNDGLIKSVKQGDFSKLDTVVSLAQKHDLKLLITLNDDGDLDLQRVAEIDHAIARHLEGNNTVLGFDLRNEPKMQEIAGAKYPAGVIVPLQTSFVVDHYGELVSRAEALDLQAKKPWVVPANLSPDQAYYMANTYQLYLQYFDDAGVWANEHNASSLDYLSSPEGAKWVPFWNAFDQTLSMWLKVQQDAISQGDLEVLTTVGYNNINFSLSPANAGLSFQEFHSYPKPGQDITKVSGSGLARIQNVFPSQPVTLGEFGASTGDVSDSVAARNDSAVWANLAVNYAGGYIWQLHDNDKKYDAFESNLGLYTEKSVPKSAATALIGMSAARAHLAGNGQALAKLDFQTGPNEGEYVGSGPGVFMTNKKSVSDGGVHISQYTDQEVGSPISVVWGINDGFVGNAYVISGGDADVAVNMKAFNDSGQAVGLKVWEESSGGGGSAARHVVSFVVENGQLKFQAQKGKRYLIIYSLHQEADNNVAVMN